MIEKQKLFYLIEFLPYIQMYQNKTIIVKYGGSAMVNEELKKNVLKDIVLLAAIGIRVIIVHGGGDEINKSLTTEPKFIDGKRYTSPEVMEVVQKVLAGGINKSLVNITENLGGKAIGLSGIDGSMIEAEIENEELGLVGEVKNINIKILKDVLQAGYIPIIATIGKNKEGQILNINADDAACAIAIALEADNLLFLSDIPGVLREKDDPTTLISHIKLSEIPQLIEEKIVVGGMKVKVDNCAYAVKQGVKKTVIIDGRVPHALLGEILTDKGVGTLFTKG